ncbi:MAG: hypothetical protein C0623_09330, partial [Desulfuromonas sp.]
MRLKKSLILVFLLLVANPVCAEPLDLKKALVLGLQNNLDLKVVALDVQQADSGVLGQKSQFDVTAELAAGQSEAEILTASAF